MKTKYIILWLYFMPIIALSQSWSDPVTVYNDGYNESVDFTIDKNGSIHSVWAHKVETNYWKIFYSKSTDNGNTWSTAQDISLNDNLWMSDPQIIADSNNNIYVSYDYNTGDPGNMLVFMKKFDGIQWQGTDTISTGLRGSMHSRLVVDKNNKIYCFWYRGKILYRTLENGIWSSVVQLYNGNDDHYFLKSVVIDNLNNIHCTGKYHYYGQSGYGDRAMYFNCINGIWSDITILSDNTTWRGPDIAVDSNNFPSITWGQFTSNSAPANHGTFVTSFDGSSWGVPQLLIEDSPEQHAIEIDQFNKKYIVDLEKDTTGYQQVLYTNTLNNWSREIIQQDNYGYYSHKLLEYDNKLYLMYIKVDTIFEQNGTFVFSRIQINKLDILSGLPDYNTNLSLNISPNPFSNLTWINFETTSFTNVQLKIHNLKGQIVNILVNENKTQGKYSILWEGNDLNGKEVSPGLYLVRLQIGRNVVTRSVILTQ